MTKTPIHFNALLVQRDILRWCDRQMISADRIVLLYRAFGDAAVS